MTLPALPPDVVCQGIFIQTLWTLLRSDRDDLDWNPRLRACLRSAMANRQWPLDRLAAAGRARHDRCCFCLAQAIIELALTRCPGGACKLWQDRLVQDTREHLAGSKRAHSGEEVLERATELAIPDPH